MSKPVVLDTKDVVLEKAEEKPRDGAAPKPDVIHEREPIATPVEPESPARKKGCCKECGDDTRRCFYCCIKSWSCCLNCCEGCCWCSSEICLGFSKCCLCMRDCMEEMDCDGK